MIGRILANRYRIVELRGTGGMAIVYRAIDENTKHDVAVKILRPDLARDEDYVTRFQREAVAASRMTHHNIVNLIDVGMDGDLRFLVMEFISGKTLKDLIRERGRLSPRLATEITIRILSALQHAHDNGIIHRDIKPQNILVQDDGIVKVTDFGIARIADSATLTKGDVVMGSVHYLSPEQASGHPVDSRTDIYSVGVVLYEMLTGRVPFDGENQVSIAMKHIHDMPPAIEAIAPEVPQSLIAVCMKALNKNPEYRYQTASYMAQDLRLVMDGQLVTNYRAEDDSIFGLGKQPTDSVATDEKPKPRVNWPWWIFTLLTMSLVFLGLYWGAAAIYENVVNSTEVPYVIGMELSAATKSAQKANLSVEIINISHPTVPEGNVVMQAPEEGTVMKKGDTVVLTISTGPANVEAPMLKGLNEPDAISKAQSMGLSCTVQERVISNEAKGSVLSQVPEAGEIMKVGDSMMIKVSGGVATVPDVQGKTFPEARATLVRAGMVLSDNVNYEPTEDVEKHNMVMAQSPAPGLQVIQDTVVDLTVYYVPSMIVTVTDELQLQDTPVLQRIRVMLVSEGTEYLVFRNDYTADSVRNPTFSFYALEKGRFTYHVYNNDLFAYQREIEIGMDEQAE